MMVEAAKFVIIFYGRIRKTDTDFGGWGKEKRHSKQWGSVSTSQDIWPRPRRGNGKLSDAVRT